MSIKIKVGDRWCIVGGTGSGKTVLCRQLINILHNATAGRVPIVIIDSKIVGDFNAYEARKDLTQVIRGNNAAAVVKNYMKKSITIWRPESDDFEQYEELLRGIYLNGRNKNQPCIIVIDELSSICNGAGKAPKHWEVLNKQGRAMHIGMLNLTQSPSYIPTSLMRQATHLIRMHLNDEYDILKLSRVMGREVESHPEDDYGFWYRNCLKPKHKSPAMYFSDFKPFIGA